MYEREARVGQVMVPTDPSGRVDPQDQSLERELIALLSEHGPREGAALSSYQRLIDDVEDEGIRYLMSMILDDERRHHRIIDEMLNTIQSFVWEVDVTPSTPSVRRGSMPEVHARTLELLALEREDAKELRALRRALRSGRAYPVHGLLVEMMEQDTAKHIAILEFIADRTKP